MVSNQSNLNNKLSSDKKWRSYQSHLQKKSAKRRSYRRIPYYVILLCVLIISAQGLFSFFENRLVVPQKEYSRIFSDQKKKFGKPSLQKVIQQFPIATRADSKFDLKTGGKTYQVHLSIDNSLQQFIIDRIDQKNSKHFGFVAMDPANGRILSMVSYDKNNQVLNTCVEPNYPAASLFKIITAAAAIEKCGFSDNTPVSFNGNKYTLYKIQLKDRINQYTNKITFKESFADSVNPVFGKIGKLHLGKPVLEEYASAFGFNQQFNFEFLIEPSSVEISEDPYSWAEVACGFNNDTLISPLHGALMIAGIANNGKLIEPTLIDSIHESSQVLYQRSTNQISEPIHPHTALTLKKLMNTTISSGTAAKSFSGFRKDKILSKLHIGGKTGSINNNKYHLKYDWFAGFAEEKKGNQKIVISVLVVHQDYIGIRAARYSRMAIKEYFKDYYANTKSLDSKMPATL